jgi:hypothetical protein
MNLGERQQVVSFRYVSQGPKTYVHTDKTSNNMLELSEQYDGDVFLSIVP